MLPQWKFLYSTLYIVLLVPRIGLTALLRPSTTTTTRGDALPRVQNDIVELGADCDASYVNVTLRFERPFKGLIYAKDFSKECGFVGTLSNVATVRLPTSGCGVKLSSPSDEIHRERVSEVAIGESGKKEDDAYYYVSVILAIQQERHLRQITDREQLIRCRIDGEELSIKTTAMMGEIKDELSELKKSHDDSLSRSGRMNAWSDDDELRAMLKSTRAWMQVIPADGDDEDDDDHGDVRKLEVGAPALFTVKVTLPSGTDWRVIDCDAHDGLGDASQKLYDEHGCPMDEAVMPELTVNAIADSTSMVGMKREEAVARFAAFKFPDRNRLHLACTLALCRRACPEVNCSHSMTVRRDGRLINEDLHDGNDEDRVFDKLELFNSVEVVAPEIELDSGDYRSANKLKKDSLTRLKHVLTDGDRAFCVSPNKIAITFCVLGLIFLGVIVATVCVLLRSKSSTNDYSSTYLNRLAASNCYTRSLFSSSSNSDGSTRSSSSGGGCGIDSSSGYANHSVNRGCKLLIRDRSCPASLVLVPHSNKNFRYGKMF